MNARRAEDERVNAELTARIGTLLDKLGEHSVATAQAAEALRNASVEGQELVLSKLRQGSSEIVSDVLGASRHEIQALLEHVRAANEEGAQRSELLGRHLEEGAAAVAKAKEGLRLVAREVEEIAKSSVALMQQAKLEAQAMGGAASNLQAASTGVSEATSKARTLVEQVGVQLREQKDLLEKQRQFASELQQVWPQLFDTYLTNFKRHSDMLASSWKELHDKIEKLAKEVSGELANYSENLTDAVEQLATHLRKAN
jgi:uncharacterized protein YoxC